MSCPVCGRVSCDHSPYDRGQSYSQMMADTARDEQKLLIPERSSLSLAEAQSLKPGEILHLKGIGVMEVIDPSYPIIRKGGRVIQRSLLVEIRREQKLLIVAEDEEPRLEKS